MNLTKPTPPLQIRSPPLKQTKGHTLVERAWLTCVAQGRLRLVTLLVVPHSRLYMPLDVHLHTVLARGPRLAVLGVVGFPLRPVGGFVCEALVGADPGPHVVHLADPYPVVP